MTRVDLYSFYDGEDKIEFISLYKFIYSQKDDEFEIVLPTNLGMALMDYGYSAYAGELLAEVAESFEYFVPERGMEQGLFFRMKVGDTEKFVDVLHYILQGYCGGRDDLKYVENAIKHFEDVMDGKKDCACPGIINRLNKELALEEMEK